MIVLCIGTTPAAQRVMSFRKVAVGQVNRAVMTLEGAAGKSVNVAKVLRVLGEDPLATGFLGTGRGEEIRGILESKGIALDFVRVPVPARQCISILDESLRTVTELVEESPAVPAAHYEELLAKIRVRIAECRAVVMSGSLTTGGPVDFYRRCVEIASPAGSLTVLDAQGLPLAEALKARPGLVKPNRFELGLSLGRELPDTPALCSAMKELHERGAQRVVVTAGEAPSLAYDGVHFWRIHTPAVAAVNPIGSGDAFAASLTSRLLRGDDLGEACRWGAATGAANALTPMPGEFDPARQAELLGRTRAERL